MFRKAVSFARVTAFALALGLFGMGSAQANDLVNMLTSQLGVTEEQASGGAGSILDFAKGEMGADDFDIVTESLPDLGSLVGGGSGGGTSSLVESGSSLLGASGSDLGGVADLASSFTDLGLSPDMVGEFVPKILEYAKTNGSEQAMKLLQGALSGI